MPEKEEKFIGYNNDEHGLLLGYGAQISPGQRIERKSKLYEVEEVHQHGGLWTASLRATGKGRSL